MSTMLFIGNIGVPGLIVIVIALLLLFGGKKIPELMRGLGKGVSEFKKGQEETKDKAEEN